MPILNLAQQPSPTSRDPIARLIRRVRARARSVGGAVAVTLRWMVRGAHFGAHPTLLRLTAAAIITRIPLARAAIRRVEREAVPPSVEARAPSCVGTALRSNLLGLCGLRGTRASVFVAMAVIASFSPTRVDAAAMCDFAGGNVVCVPVTVNGWTMETLSSEGRLGTSKSPTAALEKWFAKKSADSISGGFYAVNGYWLEWEVIAGSCETVPFGSQTGPYFLRGFSQPSNRIWIQANFCSTRMYGVDAVSRTYLTTETVVGVNGSIKCPAWSQ